MGEEGATEWQLLQKLITRLVVAVAAAAAAVAALAHMQELMFARRVGQEQARPRIQGIFSMVDCRLG